ncbi:MAG TPA: PA0069 family radical SAM protein [Pseudomonadales bacterium]|nr:PA0069 family radical SAM protein [Pseudomonadales bacterium]
MTNPTNRIVKGRGALSNPAGRFEIRITEVFDDGWGEDPTPDTQPATQLFPDKTKNIIAHNQSPDVAFDQSINPYKGCEHGCVYCFARPTHAYLDLSPGIDFETKIFYKTNVRERIVEAVGKPGYVCSPIALGANTDPYQPVEKRMKITRQILETLAEWRHPVTIVTKGALVLRDLDILQPMAAQGLAQVTVSITTLDNRLKTTLEPRAAGPAARLRCVRELRAAGVPVSVLMAPVIPGLNDDEIEDVAAAVADAGARSLGYVLLRLPYELKDLFREWLDAHVPDKAGRVMKLLREMRGGRDYDSQWGQRQKGTGPLADLLARRFELARRRHNLDGSRTLSLRTDLFRDPNAAEQSDMFG